MKGRSLITLGRYPETSLKQARNEAMRILSQNSDKKPAMRLTDARTAFLEDCKDRLKQSTIERYYFSLKDIEGRFLEDVSNDVSDPNALKALKVFFNWCLDRGYVERNPFARRRVVFKKRDRVLTDDEVTVLLEYEHPPYSDIVKTLIYSGQRRNQIWRYQKEWCEGDVVTFPAWVMKSNSAHTIPVGKYVEYLYPYSFNAWSKSKLRIDKHTGVTDWVLHDIRRYFSTTMAKIGTPIHITEKLIDHRGALSGVASIYNRYSYMDEMREALRRYEDYLVHF